MSLCGCVHECVEKNTPGSFSLGLAYNVIIRVNMERRYLGNGWEMLLYIHTYILARERAHTHTHS